MQIEIVTYNNTFYVIYIGLVYRIQGLISRAEQSKKNSIAAIELWVWHLKKTLADDRIH